MRRAVLHLTGETHEVRLCSSCVFILVLTSFVTATSVLNAEFVTVTFDDDPIGEKTQPFTSVHSPLVHFSTEHHDEPGNGGFLETGYSAYDVSNGTSALRVGGTRNYQLGSPLLVMTFDVSIDFLSLDFGNDQQVHHLEEHWTKYGEMKIYSGGEMLDRVLLEANLDRLMNQTIFFSGRVFDKATFAYVTSSGAYTVANDELVDNITFNTVPEPSALTLWAIGLLVGGFVACRLGRGR